MGEGELLKLLLWLNGLRSLCLGWMFDRLDAGLQLVIDLVSDLLICLWVLIE